MTRGLEQAGGFGFTGGPDLSRYGNGGEGGREGEFPLPKDRDEVIERTHMVLSAYGERAVDVLNGMVRRGEGRDVIASVRDRPEDLQLAIDGTGEHILSGLVRDFNLPAVIKGEHNNYRSENLDDLEPRVPHVILPIDSFDNSSQYKRDLDTPPYTAVSAFFPDGEPIGAVIGDIKDGRLYMVDKRGYAVVRDLEAGQERRIFKSDVTDIASPNFTLAVYLGSNEYSLEFFRYFEHLLGEMDPKAILYAGGGAFIPALLARGAATAYMMFNEPRTETDPGAGLALAGDLDVVSIDRDTYEITPYRFDESKHDARDPFYIASANRTITEQLIEEYKIGKQLVQNRHAAWRIWTFLQLRPDLARLVNQAMESKGEPAESAT